MHRKLFALKGKETEMGKPVQHWASQKERGNHLALWITRHMVRYCPAWLMMPLVYAIVSYFFLTAPGARRSISRYQKYLLQSFPELKPSLQARGAVFKQFYSFAMSLVDRFAVWQGRIKYEDLVIHDLDNLYAEIDHPVVNNPGQILVCSHLGNTEICRALVKKHPHIVLNVLMHSAHAVKFNQALNEAGASRIKVIQVTELDADMMMYLHNCVSRGEWLAIAADRVPIRGEKTVTSSFLGQPANWPQGVWLMAGLLKVPVNTLYCLKEQGKYHLYLHRFVSSIKWQRHQRDECIRQYVDSYARQLAFYCAKAPWQWFNFFDFWNQNDKTTM